MDEESGIEGSRKLEHTEQFRVLGKAAVETPADRTATTPSAWRLCTVMQVDEFKSVVRLLPIWACGIVFATVYEMMSTMFLLQGYTSWEPPSPPHSPRYSRCTRSGPVRALTEPPSGPAAGGPDRTEQCRGPLVRDRTGDGKARAGPRGPPMASYGDGERRRMATASCAGDYGAQGGEEGEGKHARAVREARYVTTATNGGVAAEMTASQEPAEVTPCPPDLGKLEFFIREAPERMSPRAGLLVA